MTRMFFLFLLLLLPTSIFSQSFATSLDVPSLTSGPTRASGGTGMIEFDRRILVQVSGAASPAEFCLYINTVTGDIGIQYGRPGERGACDVNINDEKFTFMLVRSSGQVQTYMTREQNGVLKHYMTTGNTEVFPVSFPRMENTVLRRGGSTEPWPRREGGVGSRAYQANSTAPTFHLYGRTDPLEVTTQDFLGYSGVGYLKTNRGIFMSVRADMGSTQYRAYLWNDRTTRLDPASFQQTEVMINDAASASLERQENKLRNETFRGDCASEEQELNRMQLADVEARRRTNSTRNTSGNIYENEPTRRAYAEMMLPNLEVMNQELEVKACKANARLSRTRGEAQRESLNQRIQCYRQSQRTLSQLQSEWNAIDARYPNESGKAFAEKTRTYTRLMSAGSACR